MFDYSHPLLLLCRRLGQRFGILRPLVVLYRRLFAKPYESNFDAMMLNKIKSGDIVWDVGANVGYFTTRFADKAGAAGKVFAFEPARSTIALLMKNCKGYSTVSCENIALSDRSGELWFRDSGNDGDPTNGLSDHPLPDTTRISVCSGDELVTTRNYPVPGAIKIDVEGFEPEVIAGMKQHILPDPRLTRLFVEVHFLELNKRGLHDAPHQLVKILKEFGFAVQWADPSHLVAER